MVDDLVEAIRECHYNGCTLHDEVRYIDSIDGNHDGQDGQVIVEYRGKLFALNFVYSSWGDTWWDDKVYEVKPVERTVIFYEKVDD